MSVCPCIVDDLLSSNHRRCTDKHSSNFSYTLGCQLGDLKWWLQTRNMLECNPLFVFIRYRTRIHTVVDMRFFHINVRYAALFLAVTAFHLIPWRNSADYVCNVFPSSPSWGFFEDLDSKTNGTRSTHPISLSTSSTISHLPHYSRFHNQ